MFKGKLIAIYISEKKAEGMQSVGSVQALAGKGLMGDRFYENVPKETKRQVTLIEQEAVDAVNRDYNIPLAPNETRRNLLTVGVPLNHLVGKEFSIGSVRLRGYELCEPCNHLQKLTRPGVMKALLHRGGIRAEILSDGEIKAGDEIVDS